MSEVYSTDSQFQTAEIHYVCELQLQSVSVIHSLHVACCFIDFYFLLLFKEKKNTIWEILIRLGFVVGLNFVSISFAV